MEQLKLNNQKTLTSMEVSEMIERQHNELLKTIRQYIIYLDEGKIAHGEYFIKSNYEDANNQKRPCYDITRKGCDLIANKLTGVKGTIFTAKYIERFEQMEDALLTGISPELQAIIMHDKKMVVYDERLTKLEDTKFISPKQKSDLSNLVNEKVSKACGDKNAPAYKKMSKKLYSNLNHKVFDKFSISQRAEIPFIKFDEAMDFVSKWYPDYELAREIERINKDESNV